ncbi:hypothetical protein [Streptomyces shenzhenensis]|uniref:hypothetical protein n=1 Tax=Streptomyces shenzhenensis TaxID=943815 RepID=UPI0015F0EC75|nr:hypothetical protein [Streptomyces shenzhenensis]
MKALVVNRTLKKPPTPSGTEAPASVVAVRPTEFGVRTEFVRAADPPIAPGAVTDAGDGADRPSKEPSRCEVPR